jgi:hypothetical protein
MKKKNKLKITSPAWLKTLKMLNVDTDKLSFNELMAFKDADRYLNSPVKGSKEWQYLIHCFRLLTSYSLLTIYERKYPTLSTCWEEMDELFLNREIFDDEVFIQSWVFCDFPIKNENKTIFNFFEQFLKDSGIIEDYQDFIDCMKNTRLGLYQEVMSSNKKIKFRELFTDEIINVENIILEYDKGEVFLIRLVEIRGKIYPFGDPKCWPKEYKSNLEDMIKAKVFYFKGASVEEQYIQFMKYAGPYWMSCVVTDQACPILQPNHYLSY